MRERKRERETHTRTRARFSTHTIYAWSLQNATAQRSLELGADEVAPNEDDAAHARLRVIPALGRFLALEEFGYALQDVLLLTPLRCNHTYNTICVGIWK